MTPDGKALLQNYLDQVAAYAQQEAMMTAKDEILELMKRIPDNLTVDEALEQLQLLYDVHKGLEESRKGRNGPSRRSQATVRRMAQLTHLRPRS